MAAFSWRAIAGTVDLGVFRQSGSAGMKLWQRVMGLLAAAMLAACGDDDQTQPDAGQHRDGGPDACTDNPCLHGGSCVVVGSGFACLCTPGHKGEKCEEET